MKGKWAITISAALVLVVVGLTAGLWLPHLVHFAENNDKKIQALKDLVELVGPLLGAALVALEWLRGGKDAQTGTQTTEHSTGAGHDFIQTGENVQTGGAGVGGNISSGGDVVGGNKTVTDQSRRAEHDFIEHQIIKHQVIQRQTIIHGAAPLPAPALALHSVPPPPADFTGRESELDEQGTDGPRPRLESSPARRDGLREIIRSFMCVFPHPIHLNIRVTAWAEALKDYHTDSIRRAFRMFRDNSTECPALADALEDVRAIEALHHPVPPEPIFPLPQHECREPDNPNSLPLSMLAAVDPYAAAHVACSPPGTPICPKCGAVSAGELNRIVEYLIKKYPAETGGWAPECKGYKLCQKCRDASARSMST